VHHVIEWQHGGRTDLNNLVMLCCAHHDQVHDTEWTIDMSTGRPRFIPPAWLSELHGAAT
jgi:5-methylcytosine-specific restriction protein A